MPSKLRTLFLALLTVSCGTRENTSSLDDFKDIQRAEQRADGLYNVVCMNGSIEIGVSLNDITGDRVCKSSGPTLPVSNPHYTEAELAAVQEVFRDLGELFINPADIGSSLADTSKTVTYSAQENGLPWAAYWYPKRGRDMYESAEAPLRKLDLWLQVQGSASSIVPWELENYDVAAAAWEGLTDAWAMASIATREPQKTVTIDGITFTPADLKAITIKYYEGYRPRIYGRRYQGLAATDGQIQDLRPEAFHRIVEEYIGRQKNPIIIDEDPGQELWSKPVFRYAFNMAKDPDHAQALLVKAYPWMIRPRFTVDGRPTSLVNDVAAPTYEYRLYHDAKPTADGRLKIISGEWLEYSMNFHPDMVFLPQDGQAWSQPNPEMRNNAAAIRRLLQKAGVLTQS